MTPKELYERTPEKIDNDINILTGCYYNFVPEVTGWNWWIDTNIDLNKHIKIHYYKDYDFDGRRFWRLAAVKYKDEFVMIIQNAGREGDDWAECFITNFEAYVGMIGYLQTLVPCGEIETVENMIDENEDLGDKLVKFYDNELDGHFGNYSGGF